MHFFHVLQIWKLFFLPLWFVCVEFISEEKEFKLHSHPLNLKYDSQHKVFKILKFNSYLYAIYSPPSGSIAIGSRTPCRYQNMGDQIL